MTNCLVPDLKGKQEVTVLDMDKVEERNFTAGTQRYTAEQVGLSKVEALQFNIFKWYEREIKILQKDIMDMDFNTIKEYDLIIDCFDNFRARNRLQSFAQRVDKPVLHVGFSDQFTFAIEWSDNYKVPTDITTGMDICEMPGAAAFATCVGSLAALVAERYVDEKEKMEILGGKYEHKIIK